MIEAMKMTFDKLYSIELDEDFCRAARPQFAEDRNIEIILGDSGQKLKDLMPRLTGPILFWLDGGGDTARGSEDTPVLTELDHILASPDLSLNNDR